MNEGDFRSDPQVQAFARWCGPLDLEQASVDWVPVVQHRPMHFAQSLAPGQARAPANLATLPIRLSMKASGHVAGGMKPQTVFSRLVPAYYTSRIRQPLVSRRTADWTESCQLMAGLGQELRSSAMDRDLERLLGACEKVLKWGGDRAATIGAWPVLRSLGQALPAYLFEVEAALDLSDCVLQAPEIGHPEVRHMNAMLTRIHSLFATDGLPVYESRVAGAIATIVETWRRKTGQAAGLSPNLAFPAVGGAGRCVLDRYTGAADPGTLRYNSPSTAGRWAGAMVRLGWLMKLLLGGSPAPAEMRWLEASLFVAGDDVWGINRTSPLKLPARLEHPATAAVSTPPGS